MYSRTYIPMGLMMVIIFASPGATCRTNRVAATNKDVAANKAALDEEVRALTTGARDALYFAPTNPPTALAGRFLDRDQAIIGLPISRIDVPGVLAGNKPAVTATNQRLESQSDLLRERTVLEVKQQERNQQLMELGTRYEEEHKKSLIKRIWLWGVGIFGTVGAIAFFVICPGIAIPIFTRLAAWLVSVIPKLAGFLGVIGTNAFDGVVKGVQNAKTKIEKPAPSVVVSTPTAILADELSKATDQSHKGIIEVRKEALAAKGEIPAA